MSSAAVLAEAVHSGIDLLAAVFAFWAVRQARRPADVCHSYGHGKFDALSGAIEGLLIFVAAGYIIYKGILKIMGGGEVERLGLGAATMALSGIVNFFVSRHLFAVARRTGSVAVEADGHHLRTDVWTSVGVFVGLGLIWVTGVHLLDPIIAIGVAVFILRAAWSVTRKAAADLLDKSLPAAEEARIARIIREGHPHWLGFHRLRTRRAGPRRFIDLHLVTCRDISVQTAHEFTEDLETDIKKEYPGAEVITHVEACEAPPEDCDSKCPMAAARRNVVNGPREENGRQGD